MNGGGESRKVGLSRALSKLGFCSRSQAAVMIRAGRVRLNGAKRGNPEHPVRLDRDRIEVDGKVVTAKSKTYVMLNKPRGVVTTAADEKSRETVYAFLPENVPWLGPVGRLDKASEGLLLLTNDSEWAARISDPHSHLDKTYHVQVAAMADEAVVEQLVRGVLADGELLRAKSASILRSGEKNTWLEIVLDEGRNRQIRRMAEQLRMDVLRLVRVAIGPLVLGELKKGQSRAITRTGKEALDRAINARLGEKQH